MLGVLFFPPARYISFILHCSIFFLYLTMPSISLSCPNRSVVVFYPVRYIPVVCPAVCSLSIFPSQVSFLCFSLLGSFFLICPVIYFPCILPHNLFFHVVSIFKLFLFTFPCQVFTMYFAMFLPCQVFSLYFALSRDYFHWVLSGIFLVFFPVRYLFYFFSSVR
jgi:hypothetical protein